jgi:hypothetical protein
VNDNPLCREIRDLLPELGLDVLTGEERARALHHVARCAACRGHLSELREVADDLLLLAPSREPPAGFESRVLEEVGGRGLSARRSRWRWLLAAAAAVLLAAAGSAAGVYLATGEVRELAAHYRDALEQADGRYFGGIALHDERRERVGTVFGYEGSPSWILVVLEVPEESGRYEVVLVTREREQVPVGSLELTDGNGSWGRAIPVSLRNVARVQLVSEEGESEFQADIPP